MKMFMVKYCPRFNPPQILSKKVDKTLPLLYQKDLRPLTTNYPHFTRQVLSKEEKLV